MNPAAPSHPAPENLEWQIAGLADGPEILELMRAFYAEERLLFDANLQGRALDRLLVDPALGAVYLLRVPGLPGLAPLGHLVLTTGHSLEHGGAYYLLDELYLDPRARGRGLGRQALDLAARHARSRQARSLRLEVSPANRHARALYQRAGFGSTRETMSLPLV
jgi:ribosomal protein S18 acetylase RimI-like enzyme